MSLDPANTDPYYDNEPETSDLQSLGFTIEGDVSVQIQITENPDGSLSFTVDVLDGGSIGDINGLFFDFGGDAALLDGLQADGADVTREDYDEGDVTNLGGGTNVSGALTADGGFDAGIRFGSSGMAKDDLQSVSFTLSHESEPLTIEMFELQDFAVRLTSVGEEGGTRDDSLKLGGTSGEADEFVFEDDPFGDGGNFDPYVDGIDPIDPNAPGPEDNPDFDPYAEPTGDVTTDPFAGTGTFEDGLL